MKISISIIASILIVFITISAAQEKEKSILIDPGHSPNSIGAISCSGKPEYIYNDLLAKSVTEFLKSKQISVDLTRREQENINIIDRTSRSSHYKLLLSLHHDSVQTRFLDRKSRNHGQCSEKAKGFSIFISRKNQYYEKSIRYAEALGTALVNRGLTPTLHHAEPIIGENRELLVPDKGIYVYDNLSILKNAQCPALLLEAAVIVNPREDLLSGTVAFRLIVAESIYDMLAK
jgi:N-acetylmuramoyl-L-alanine amidase